MHYLMRGCFTLYVSTVNKGPLPIWFCLEIVSTNFHLKLTKGESNWTVVISIKEVWGYFFKELAVTLHTGRI